MKIPPLQTCAADSSSDGRTRSGASTEQALRDQLAALQTELNETKRLLGVGASMAGLAHSVRSTLGLCRGAIFMVDRAVRRRSWDDLERAWAIQKRSSSRVSDLVQGLLNPDEADRLQLAPGDPDTVVREVADIASEQAREQGDQLSLNLAGDLLGVIFDRLALHRCCVELVANSLDALAESSGPGEVGLQTGRKGGSWFLQVSDSGPGMSAQQLRRSLHGGYSTKGRRGSGLGLSVVRRLVEGQGGSLTVRSLPGKGTTITCWFPGRATGSESGPAGPRR
jgi:signal transduction histidine kinase